MEHECPSGGRHCWNLLTMTVGTHERCCFCREPNPHADQGNGEEDDLS